MREDEADLGFIFKRISMVIGRSMYYELEPYALTPSQMRIIFFLARQPNYCCRQREIEQRFGVSHPTVVGLLKRLELKEMVATRPALKEKRCKEVMLTEEAAQLLSALASNREKAEKQLRKNLSEEDLQELQRLMKQIYQNAVELLPEDAVEASLGSPVS